MLKKEWKEKGFIDEPIAEGTDLKSEIRRLAKEKDAVILAHGIDRKGILHDVAEIISKKLSVNIHKVNFTAEDGIFEGKIEIRVHDRDEVKVIVDELKKIDDLQEVQHIM